MTERAKIIERLREEAQHRTNGVELNALLTEAADLLEAEESREEYRMVTELEEGPSYNGPFCSRQLAEKNIEHSRSFPAYADKTFRIQRSEVTRTPWVDVETGETGQ